MLRPAAERRRAQCCHDSRNMAGRFYTVK